MIQNGSFGGTYTDEKLWHVTLLLAHANQLPPTVQDVLRQPDSAPVTPSDPAKKAD